jgi:uncharacterized protein YwgA
MSNEERPVELTELIIKFLQNVENGMTDLRLKINSIEVKIDGYNNLKEKLNNTANLAENNTKDIGRIDESLKWIRRTTVAACITGLASIIVGIVVGIIVAGIKTKAGMP